MPQGLSKIKQIAKEAAAKRAAYEEGGPGIRFLKIEPEHTERVRFLEQGEEVWYLYTHKLPKMPGQRFGDDVQCLDQDDQGIACPGCERQISRSTKIVINVIWYDAPKFERDKDKKIVKDSSGNPKVIGKENCVATWVRGSTQGGRLEYLDSEYGGLTGHIFKINRQGSTKDDTTYNIDIAEQNVPPTPADAELYKSKPDPRLAIKKMTYGDMARAYSGGGVATTTQQQGSEGMGSPESGNAFASATAGAVNKGAFG